MDQKLDHLLSYWNDLRNGRTAPYREEVDPACFRDLLENTFIAQCTVSGEARFRLAGTRLCDLFGMELRGLNLLSLWTGDSRHKLGRLLHRTVNDPCIGHVVGLAETELRRTLDFEALLLPLRNNESRIDRVIGALVVRNDGPAGRIRDTITASWIDATSAMTIHRYRPTRPAQPRVAATASDGQAPLAAALGMASAVGRARPALTLIQGGKGL